MNISNFKEVMDDEEVIQLLVKLVQIETENLQRNEERLVELILEIADKEGLCYEVDEYSPGRFNVYMSIGQQSSGIKLLYNGHTDVVPAGEGWSVHPYSGAIIDNKVYGRGSCDMKAGVAAMLASMITLKRGLFQPQGFLLLALVADEEEHQSGTLRLMEKYPDFDYAIVGEPSKMGLVVAHKGNMYIKVTAISRASQASVPHMGVNAVEEMSKFINYMESYKKSISERVDPLLGPPTIASTMINGGKSACVIPETCEAVFDRRVVSIEDPKAVWEEIQDLVGEYNKKCKANFSLECLWEASGMHTPENSRIISELIEASKEVTGAVPETSIWPAVADSGILAAHGIETVLFGPGDITVAHKPDEYVPIDELLNARLIYAQVALSMLKGGEELGIS